MSEDGVGCAKPSGRVVGDEDIKNTSTSAQTEREESMVQAKVGGKAPDFEAPAYHKGQFTNVKLSDHLGKWVMLCFYPGDFTFV